MSVKGRAAHLGQQAVISVNVTLVLKKIRFQLNSDDGTWLDPRSVVQYELKNETSDTNKILRPLRGPRLFLRGCVSWLALK